MSDEYNGSGSAGAESTEDALGDRMAVLTDGEDGEDSSKGRDIASVKVETGGEERDKFGLHDVGLV